MGKYKIDSLFNLPSIENKISRFWKDYFVFKKSTDNRKGAKTFVFYEGPPSANGKPGIHHVLGRTVKDVFCRYKTMQGFMVDRRAGWDTHGLPVELEVEKELGIKKDDIGNNISVEEYNKACKEAVMKYTNIWNKLTEKMAYWVNMDNPYITYDSKYMESVWWILKRLFNKSLLYKGFSIQPYSPKAGTGLSSHELNQPGCYKNVKDTTVTAQFKLKNIKELFGEEDYYAIAWTTTPWTLPANTALCIGKKIDYCVVKTFNPYTHQSVNLIFANELIKSVLPQGKFKEVNTKEELEYEEKETPFFIRKIIKGKDLMGLEYEQLMDYVQPYKNTENAFRIISGDFVTTTEGTGIVHIAPTFGSDDNKVALQNNIPPMLVLDKQNIPTPIVDKEGKYWCEMGELTNRYVKNEYYPENEVPEKSVDVLIAIKLKTENKAFNVKKYEHSYPHCWRTDKPILYYPLNSWFVKTTTVKEDLVKNNQKINWLPKSTGEGRFGNWLENINDWNLSRSRFWGIPLPIWLTEDGSEQKCIGSVEELKRECEKSVKNNLMESNILESFQVGDMSSENYDLVDLHKHVVDSIILCSSDNKPMKREEDIIDVWFDSGSMPYAQNHYPFENKDLIDKEQLYPADFIAEGVDQTRGWFFTLHTISTMLFNKLAFKNVISNGLVLDKKGHKMSKRLGNAIDPFKAIEEYGSDSIRWYIILNTPSWDNLKFDMESLKEVHKKFFNTLHNTYNFFALYANIDDFDYSEPDIDISKRKELDRWILSKLNSLIKEVTNEFDNYNATFAVRAINHFVLEHLSNWYIRLNRRRFWKGDYEEDKISAYQTLYHCLITICKLAAPIVPFYSDYLYQKLTYFNPSCYKESVHLEDFPELESSLINNSLEQRMAYAQRISSMVLSIRKKENIKVRQALSKILIPLKTEQQKNIIKTVEDIILSEVNVKNIEYLDENDTTFFKIVAPNFRELGPKLGKNMKQVQSAFSELSQKEILKIEKQKKYIINIGEEAREISLELNKDFDILVKDIPNYISLTDKELTIALNIEITQKLFQEGISREIVNRIQNFRKDNKFDIQDNIEISVKTNDKINQSITNFEEYIFGETLANSIKIVDYLEDSNLEFDLDDVRVKFNIKKI